jgi:acyl-CoA thioester hydrolase
MQSQREHIRVRWVDTDASGRIHYTAAFRWVELVETELFRRHQLMDGRDRYPRRHVEAEYLQPISFDDELELELTVEKIGTSSISFSWIARRADETVARGTQTVVHVSENGRPAPLPDAVRQRLV